MASGRSQRRVGVFLSTRNQVLGFGALFTGWLVFLPSTPAQATLAGVLLGAAAWLYLTHRGRLEPIRIERVHQPRVFEGDRVEVTLRLLRGDGLPVRMLEIEDAFMASLESSQRQLVPSLAEGWEVSLAYDTEADRHRGLYLLGPVHLLAGDALGVFFERRQVDHFTRLTVYPRAEPLPAFEVPCPPADSGPSLDTESRVGMGEEILGVREYRPGDPPARVHWRTTARRGQLHVLELNRPIQSELMLVLDLTRRSRVGLGAESSTEWAIQAAVSILSRAYEARHRFSMALCREGVVQLPTGAGLEHLHLLLDQLAIIQPQGDGDFWGEAAASALGLAAGSRAVFVVPRINVELESATSLMRRLIQRGVGVDLVLIDERDMIRIYRDQEENVSETLDAGAVKRIFSLLGVRVTVLSRDRSRMSQAMISQVMREGGVAAAR